MFDHQFHQIPSYLIFSRPIFVKTTPVEENGSFRSVLTKHLKASCLQSFLIKLIQIIICDSFSKSIRAKEIQLDRKVIDYFLRSIYGMKLFSNQKHVKKFVGFNVFWIKKKALL